MITLFNLLLHSSGLSVQEAASEFRVSEQKVIDWCHGSATPIEKVIQYLFYLVDLQDHAAGWVLFTLMERARKEPEEIFRICITDDVHEAGTLGWPTPSAMNAAVRRLLEKSGNLRSRIQLVFNPRPEESSGIIFISTRLRPDGAFEAPGETTPPPDVE
jgi:hypothetical protein